MELSAISLTLASAKRPYETSRGLPRRTPPILSVIGRYSLLMDDAIRYPNNLNSGTAFLIKNLEKGDYDGRRGFAPSQFFLP